MSAEPDALIFEDVLIFTGDDFIENGFVVVENGKITQRGSGACYDIPTGARKISRPVFTLLPELIDSHVHGLFGNEQTLSQSLRFGVTTVLDMHNEPEHIAKLRKLARDDKSRYADFKACGTGATIEGGWPAPVVLSHGETPQARATVESWRKLRTPADAEAFVEEQIHRSGASYIKIMHETATTLKVDPPKPSVEVWKAVVNAAHARGLIVVGHAYSYDGAIDLLNAGVDGLTHMFLDKPASDDYINLCLQNSAHCNPTLTGNASQSKQGHDLQVQFAADPFAQKMLFDTTPRKYLGLANERADIENSYESTKGLYAAGVPLIVGSDASGQPRGQAYGLTVHMEMYQMVHKIGMSVIDVLKSATSLIADRFGFNDIGRIDVGKKADLVLVEGDIRELLLSPETLCLPIRGIWRDGVAAAAYEE